MERDRLDPASSERPLGAVRPRDGLRRGRGVTVLFGGYTGPSNSDTWEWNGTAWTQRAVSGPSARQGHAMAYDAARGVTVLFGGYNISSATPSGETWEWNGTTWIQRVVGGPSPRS